MYQMHAYFREVGPSLFVAPVSHERVLSVELPSIGNGGTVLKGLLRILEAVQL